MAERLGTVTALAGGTGKHKHMTFPSKWQTLLRSAATLMILTRLESLKVLNASKFWVVPICCQLFFACENGSKISMYLLEHITDQSIEYFLTQSFNHSLV